jgi:hypothetical protein
MKQKGNFPKQMKQKRKMKMFKKKMGTFPKKMNLKTEIENCAVTSYNIIIFPWYKDLTKKQNVSDLSSCLH